MPPSPIHLHSDRSQPGHRMPQAAVAAREEVAPWLMSLGDLLLILLCMFLLLAAVERRRNAEGRDAVQPRAGADLETSLGPRDAGVVAGWSVDPDGPIRQQVDAPMARPEASTSGGAAQSASEVEAALRDIFRPAGDLVEIEADPGAVTVRLRDAITFPSGTADLLPEVLPLLDQVADLLGAFPDVRIETSGHTDDVPIATSVYPSNWELSAARAAGVARYLLSRASIDPRRIKIAGYAEHRPLDAASTVEGRARNRRVEIRFMGPVLDTHLDPQP